MPEPTSSTAAILLQALGATALAGALTGLDYWTLLGGVTGALMALRSQESQGAWRSFIGLVGVALLSLFATWFLVETLPALVQSFVGGNFPAMGKGRALIAWVVGYYGKSVILPAGGRALMALFARIGGQPATEEEGKQ